MLSKKCIASRRSKKRNTHAADSEGSANSAMSEMVAVLHAMIGIRLIDIPGARILSIVTTKLIEPTVVEMVMNRIPSA